MIIKVLLLFFLSFPVFAIGDEKLWEEDKPKNFCTDQETSINNENLARQHSTDERLIKLVALRAGLCGLLEKQIIDLDLAIDLFDSEKENQVLKRLQEQQASEREISL